MNYVQEVSVQISVRTEDDTYIQIETRGPNVVAAVSEAVKRAQGAGAK